MGCFLTIAQAVSSNNEMEEEDRKMNCENIIISENLSKDAETLMSNCTMINGIIDAYEVQSIDLQAEDKCILASNCKKFKCTTVEFCEMILEEKFYGKKFNDKIVGNLETQEIYHDVENLVQEAEEKTRILFSPIIDFVVFHGLQAVIIPLSCYLLTEIYFFILFKSKI